MTSVGRNLADEFFDLLHRRAVADERFNAPLLLKLMAKLAVFAAEPLFFKGFGHRLQQRGAVERFLDEIVGAEPHGFDRFLDAAMAGDHHHFDFGPEFANLFQQRDAVEVRQTQVADHQRDVFLASHVQRLPAGTGARNAVAFGGEHLAGGVAQPFVVVHQQNVAVWRPCQEFSANGRKMVNVLPLPRRAFAFDVTAVLDDDLLDEGQPQAGALCLGGEERHKHLLELFLSHAFAACP